MGRKIKPKNIIVFIVRFCKKYRSKNKIQKGINELYLQISKLALIKYKQFKRKFKKWIKKKNSEIREITKKLLSFIRYIDFYFTKYKLIVPRFLSFQIRVFLNKWSGLFFTLIYFASLAFFMYKIEKVINLSVRPDVATSFFFGSAAIVGSLLAIVTSFSQFAIQNAFSNLPKGFYEIAINIWKYISIFFFVSLIVFALLIAGLGYGRLGIGYSGLSIKISLCLIGFSFYLIYLLNRYIYLDINPENVLLKAAKQSLDTLSQLYKTILNLVKIEQKDPRKNIAADSLPEIEAFHYQTPQVKTILSNVNLRLAYLFDYHDSLVSTEQKSAAREVLDYIRSIVINYLNSRKTNSIILPEPLALLAMTSDSKDFLQPNLERLMSVSETYMRKQDTYGIMHVVNLFIALAKTSADIKYIGLRRSENPILEQIRGYFDMTMQRAINISSFEGIYQGLRFYKVIASIAIDKGLHLELNSLHSMLWKLTASAISIRHEPALGEIFNVYSFIINKLITTKYFNFEHELSYLLKHLKDITYFSYLSVVSKGTLRDDLFTQNDISKPYEQLRDMVFWVIKQVNDTMNIEEKNSLERVLIIIVDELRQVIRDLAQDIKNADHILVLSFAQVIRDIGKILINLSRDPQWSRHQSELETQISAYLALPEWFIVEAEKIDTGRSTYDSLIEATAQIGLVGLQKGMNDFAKRAIEKIFRFANEMFTKEKPELHRGFTEPKTVEYSCYIGILALKLGQEEIIHSIIPQIQTFETAYLQNYFSNIPEGIDINRISPSPNRLKEEVEALVRDRERWQFERFGLYDTKEILFGLIEKEDILNFINRIWSDARSE